MLMSASASAIVSSRVVCRAALLPSARVSVKRLGLLTTLRVDDVSRRDKVAIVAVLRAAELGVCGPPRITDHGRNPTPARLARRLLAAG
jgi:hypothetical protein